jgi:hypothetical protein
MPKQRTSNETADSVRSQIGHLHGIVGSLLPKLKMYTGSSKESNRAVPHSVKRHGAGTNAEARKGSALIRNVAE